MRTSYLSLFNFIKSYPLGNIEKKKKVNVQGQLNLVVPV